MLSWWWWLPGVYGGNDQYAVICRLAQCLNFRKDLRWPEALIYLYWWKPARLYRQCVDCMDISD